MKMWVKIFLVGTFIILGIIGWCHWRKISHSIQPLFKTEEVTKKTIKQTITVSGVLEIKDTMQIASIKDGTITEVNVKLNEKVKRGQILAIVSTTIGKTEYHEALHDFEKAQHESDYQKRYFERQKTLYKAGHIAQNTFENINKTYKQAQDDLEKARATLEKKKEDFYCTYIKAPTDGTVIAVEATKGKVVTTYTNPVLFQIARDVHSMKVTLEIDESDIGLVKKGQPITLVPNAFPERKIKTIINEISYIPKTKNDNDASTTFRAIADVDNSDGELRPGMLVNAIIKVNEAHNVLCISGLAFHLNRDILQAIAKKIGYKYVPLTKDAIKSFKKTHSNEICRVVWVVEGKNFIQKIIRLGITDDTFWQVVTGLNDHDSVITDIEETNELEELLKKHSSTF